MQYASGSSSPNPSRTSNRWPHFGHCEAAMSALVPQASHRTERIRTTSLRRALNRIASVTDRGAAPRHLIHGCTARRTQCARERHQVALLHVDTQPELVSELVSDGVAEPVCHVMKFSSTLRHDVPHVLNRPSVAGAVNRWTITHLFLEQACNSLISSDHGSGPHVPFRTNRPFESPSVVARGAVHDARVNPAGSTDGLRRLRWRNHRWNRQKRFTAHHSTSRRRVR